MLQLKKSLGNVPRDQGVLDDLEWNLDSKSIKRAITISCSLILALLKDMQARTPSRKKLFQELGWRNKYNIHLLSGISQKIIYHEYGIIERLVDLGIIKRKKAPTKWGMQKYHYRIADAFVKDLLDRRDLSGLVI